MQPILSNYTASITELKKPPTQILENMGEEVVVILNHNVASAYLVPSQTYEKLNRCSILTHKFFAIIPMQIFL